MTLANLIYTKVTVDSFWLHEKFLVATEIGIKKDCDQAIGNNEEIVSPWKTIIV